MRVRVETKALREAIGVAARATKAKSTMPVLGSLLFWTYDGGLSITGYDLETSVTVLVPAAVEATGAGCLPARPLLALIGHLDANEVTIGWDEEGRMGEIAWGSGQYRLPGFPEADYPDVPRPEGDAILRLPVETIRELLSRTLVSAASPNDGRPMLFSVLLRSDAGRLVAVGARSISIAVQTLPLTPSQPIDHIVSASGCRVLLSVLPDSGEVDVFAAKEAALVWQTDSLSVVTRCLEGQYPDVLRLFPKRQVVVAECDRDALTAAVQRAAVADADEIVLHMTDGSVRVSASSEIGNYEESLNADMRVDTDGGLLIRFGPRYLLDGLRALRGERVRLECSDERSPAVLVDPDDDTYRYMLMPRVSM